LRRFHGDGGMRAELIAVIHSAALTARLIHR